MQFVQDFPFNQVGMCKYSQEEGTIAGRMEGQISADVKEGRHQRLAAVQQRMAESLNENLIRQQLEVVVESYHPESEWLLVGRYRGESPEIDGQVLINDWRLVDSFGERYQVKVTEVAGYDLISRVIKKLYNPLKLF